uniref:Uncharacterized protein n=1 Tax=viral metagenome TaxID=1070528 RepID=A0A6C0BDK1_9ZZZZ
MTLIKQIAVTFSYNFLQFLLHLIFLFSSNLIYNSIKEEINPDAWFFVSIIPGFLILIQISIEFKSFNLVFMLFQFIYLFISYFMANYIDNYFKRSFYLIDNLVINLTFIIFYSLYKSFLFIWFKIIKVVVLIVEIMLCYNSKRGQCHLCNKLRNLLLNTSKEVIDGEIISTCYSCDFLICRECYINNFILTNKCKKCGFEKESFNISELTSDQFTEITIKILYELIIFFTDIGLK